MFRVAKVQEKLPKMHGAIHLSSCSSCFVLLTSILISFLWQDCVKRLFAVVYITINFSPFCPRVFTVTSLLRAIISFYVSLFHMLTRVSCVLRVGGLKHH